MQGEDKLSQPWRLPSRIGSLEQVRSWFARRPSGVGEPLLSRIPRLQPGQLAWQTDCH